MSQWGLRRGMGGGVGVSGGSFASISVWKVVHPEDCLPFGMHKEYGRRSRRNSVIVRNPPRRFSIFSAFCFRTPRFAILERIKVGP